jgi:hypothetical protein
VVQPFEARSVFAALIASRSVQLIAELSAVVLTVIVAALARPGQRSSAVPRTGSKAAASRAIRRPKPG